MGVLTPPLREKRQDQNDLPISTVLQVSLVQNSPYAKMAYFGAMYSFTLHHLLLYSNIKCNHNCFNVVLV